LSMKETHVPETEEYGIGSFVYKARRPFHPQRLDDLISNQFFLIEKPNDNYEDEELVEESKEPNEDDEENQVGQENESVQENEDGEENGPVGIDPEDAKLRLENKKNGPFKNLIRSKGFIWLATRPKNSGEWSQAGLMLTIENGGNWFSELPKSMWPDSEEMVEGIMADYDEKLGDKRQEIVFIGQFKDKEKESAEIKKAFDECLCTDEEMEQVEKLEFEDWSDPFEYWPSFEEE
jgi:G3E family GTPase